MNDNQKRTAVHMYQFSSYKPIDKFTKFTKPSLCELMGPVYPYRKKDLDVSFLDVFHKEKFD